MRNQHIMSWESWDLTWLLMGNILGPDKKEEREGQSEGRRDRVDKALVLRICHCPQLTKTKFLPAHLSGPCVSTYCQRRLAV